MGAQLSTVGGKGRRRGGPGGCGARGIAADRRRQASAPAARLGPGREGRGRARGRGAAWGSASGRAGLPARPGRRPAADVPRRPGDSRPGLGRRDPALLPGACGGGAELGSGVNVRAGEQACDGVGRCECERGCVYAGEPASVQTRV